MTENKVYYVVRDNLGEYSVLKGEEMILICTEIQHKVIAELFCDELNDLAEENEELKRRISNLEHTRDFCADVCADCDRLEQKNEHLKRKIERERNTHFKQHQKWEKEVEHEINKLKKDKAYWAESSIFWCKESTKKDFKIDKLTAENNELKEELSKLKEKK